MACFGFRFAYTSPDCPCYPRGVNIGVRVEVRARFDQRWARGFELVEVVQDKGEDRYRVRRRSDGSVLPALFVDDDVREEKKRSSSIWWV